MPESMCTAGGVELCYETFGDPADPAVLLVMGLATQMIGWHEDFCAALAGRGFHVIRYDNRDVGRSSSIQAPAPTAGQLLRRSRKAAAYTLDDMANDGIGVLDHLGIERAHVVGVSMGGMIAQMMAARYPDRVLSLASIMSNTGARWSGQPHPAMYRWLLRPAPAERDAYIEHTVQMFTRIGSPGFPRDEAELRRTAALSYERGRNPAGAGRQLAAILATGDRRALLRTISAPTVVIHGTADRLVAPSGGRATAQAISGARLLMIDGLGHDLPRGAWPQLLDAIVANVERAGAGAAASRAA